MAPREANNPFADQYLTIEYDATAMILPHDTGAAPANDNMDLDMNMGMDVPMDVDPDPPATVPVPVDAMANRNINATTLLTVDEQSVDDNSQPGNATGGAATATGTGTLLPPIEVLFQTPGHNQVQVQLGQGVPANLSGDNHGHVHASAMNARPRPAHPNNISNVESDIIQDIDPLAIDMSDPDEEDTWNSVNALLVNAAMASASENCVVTTGPTTPSPNRHRFLTAPSANRGLGLGDSARRRSTSDFQPANRGSIVTPVPGEISNSGSGMFGNLILPPHPSQRRRRNRHLSLGSVLDQDPSMDSGTEDELESEVLPGLDTTQDSSTASPDDLSSSPATPSHMADHHLLLDSPGSSPVVNSNANSGGVGLSFSSPARRMLRGETNLFHSSNNNVNIVVDEDTTSSGSSFTSPNADHHSSSFNMASTTSMPAMPSAPHRVTSSSSSMTRRSSVNSVSSGRSITWNAAFDSNSNLNFDNASEAASVMDSAASLGENASTQSPSPNPNSNQINLAFGPNTTVADLKYFAERGCIVPLLRALNSPRLKTLGTRMLADYAKMPHRRVAVASNRRILEFCCRTMLEMPSGENMGTDWPAREYAVETIRSLTATEDSDGFLMGCPGLLKALAIVARGGPFASYELVAAGNCQMTPNMGLVSGKARLHSCIAIMNLSCGKANKIEIASITEVLDAMRDVMMAKPDYFSPATSNPVANGSSSNATPKSVSEEARLKAATCIKNLSNADRNDAALLNAGGLIEALAHVAATTCAGQKGATNCTTNACLALMNLSISKANKHKVFKTEGVMDALMAVLERTSPLDGRRSNSNNEARIKACSALSNLAIGYENKIPMFNYPGFVGSILQVIETDSGEARTKACSILWSFAAEMKNQVPVVQRGDILPTLVRVAEEDSSTEARFKCVAALTLLAESLDNAMPLLESGALHPLMDILHDAGADPTQWKGQTASWCVGFLMNMSQSDEAAPYLREAGVVELLAPLLTLDHYQSLKAAMAVTFVCRYDEDDETYDLLRKTENVIPKIISLLHNTLGGKGGNGYKYGVFTLRSSVGCISSLASGPEFMKERIATKAVYESLLKVVNDFCVGGGNNGAIVGGGRDDTHSATLAIRALQALTEYLIPIPGSSALPFGPSMDTSLMTAMESFGACTHPAVLDKTRDLAKDGFHRIQSSLDLNSCPEDSDSASEGYGRRRINTHNIIENSIVASLVQGCCIGPSLHAGFEDGFFPSMIRTPARHEVAVDAGIVSNDENMSQSSSSTNSQGAVRTFLLIDSRTGRRFAVPTDPSGGRAFNDGRTWCYRRGRFSRPGEVPDPNYRWTEDLQAAYTSALDAQNVTTTPAASQSSLSSHNSPAPTQVSAQAGNFYLGNQ
jgi:hypothetical protein